MCDGVTQGPARHGAEPVLARHDRDGHRDRAHRTTCSTPRSCSASATRSCRACSSARSHFGHLPCVFVPGGPMVERPVEHREVAGARAARAGPGRPRRAAASRVGGLPRRRHLHLLRHRQQQPDAARGDGPARAGRGVRASARRSARGADARGGALAARHRGWRAAGSRRAAADRPAWSTSASIVNAMVALLATGGSTNHLIHWVAVARAAGIVDRLDRLRRAVAGDAAAGARLSERQRRREPVPGRGRPGFVLRELLEAGCCTPTRATRRARRHGRLHARARARARRRLRGATLPAASGDDSDRCAAPTQPFSAERRPAAAQSATAAAR